MKLEIFLTTLATGQHTGGSLTRGDAMIDDNTKRDIKRHLLAAGFDAAVVDELICERKRLRDEFAMATLGGQLASIPAHSWFDADTVAIDAYRIADAMMERRK
jgi:hypothetical protein